MSEKDVTIEVIDVDVLVVGTGNGGMTAALCSHLLGAESVLVIEKSDRYGGTSAMSGGGVWVPCNRYAKAAGGNDSLAEAKAYLTDTIPDAERDDALIDAYLEQGPIMVDFLHENSDVRYQNLALVPDYFGDAPGAKTGYRSMEPEPINSTALGDEFRFQQQPNPMVRFFKCVFFSQKEIQVLLTRSSGWMTIIIKQFLAYFLDLPLRIKGNQSRRITMGAAGVARLRLSLMKNNIPLWRNTRLLELFTADYANGEPARVTGVLVERGGKKTRINTSRGVILAAGGFEHNDELRHQYLPKPTSNEWSAGVKYNTGDAIIAAKKIGAQLRLMNNAWWITNIRVPGEEYPRLSIFEKSLPGNYTVNQSGKRVSNESQSYMTYMRELHEKHRNGEPCDRLYMIFDSEHRKKYFVGPIPPGSMWPDFLIPKRYYSEGFLAKASSIEGLAEKLGIASEGLRKTVESVNQYAKTGVDLDYHRGESPYDRYYSDPAVKPNPCLGQIIKPPFYAMRVDPGDFGTCGGVKTDTNARVLDEQDRPIPGLYAIGNCAAGILTTYPGPGGTLGPAMTFGYIAARHIAQQEKHI